MLTNMHKISVVISAYNESQKIKDCLKSVKQFADEIIVVDNSSTDGTGTIARSYGAKVFKRPNNLMLNINKNFGFTKAKNEWILNLDADERITDELQKEIEILFEKDNPDEISGYAIPRKNIIFGKWIEHTGWYPDYQLRLFRKGKGKFLEQHVHEQLSLDGTIEKLDNPMLHESYKTVKEFLLKFFVIYAPNEAQNVLAGEGKVYEPSDFLRNPFHEFINRFYFHKGYKDGLHGLVLSLLMAFYHFVVVCYIWEKKKFTDASHDTRKIISNELINMKKTKEYWELSSKIDSTTSPLHKSLHKIKRKLIR